MREQNVRWATSQGVWETAKKEVGKKRNDVWKSSKRAIVENTQEELTNKEKGTQPRSSDIE
jgi:hypothetical protein